MGTGGFSGDGFSLSLTMEGDCLANSASSFSCLKLAPRSSYKYFKRWLLGQNQTISFEGLPAQPWHYMSTCMIYTLIQPHAHIVIYTVFPFFHNSWKYISEGYMVQCLRAVSADCVICRTIQQPEPLKPDLSESKHSSFVAQRKEVKLQREQEWNDRETRVVITSTCEPLHPCVWVANSICESRPVWALHLGDTF